MATSRSKWKWIVIISAPLIVFALLIVLLPTFISAGLGHGRILAAIQPHINGRADFASLRIRWRGPQEMTALRIRDTEGKEVANLDLNTNLSLLGLIFGRVEFIELNIAGTLDGTWHTDGTTSFQKLVKRDDPPKRAEPEVFELRGLPELRVNLDLRRVNLRDEASGRTVILSNAAGGFHYEPNRTVSLLFESETDTDGLSGSIKLSALGDQLFDARGRFSPAHASATIDFEAVSLPIFGLEEPGELQRVVVSVRSADLTDRFILELDVDAQIEGMEPSKLEGGLTVASLFRGDGTMDFRPENVSGSISGDRVPSVIVQPFLAATPIVLVRDAGPTVDVEVDFVAGDELVAAARAVGSQYNATLDVDATFNLETGQWQGRRLVISSDHAHPDLVEGYTGLRIQQPTDVVIELTSFDLPPVDESLQKRPLRDYSATGSITANGPLLLMLESETHGTRTMHVEQVQLNLDSSRLGDGITANGSLYVEGGHVEFDQRITHLFDDAGNIDAVAAKPVGILTVTGLPSHSLTEWLPDHAEMLTEALGEAFNAELTTRIVDDQLEAKLNLRAARVTSTATVLHLPHQLRIIEAKSDLTITPRMAELAQQEQPRPIALLEPIALTIEVEPLTLTMNDPFVPSLPDVSHGPVRLAVRSPRAVLDGIELFAEPIDLRNLVVNLGILMNEAAWTYDMQARGALIRLADDNRIATLNADVQIEPGEVMAYRGQIALTAIRTRRLEILLGREHNSLMDWIGDNGDITASVNGRGMEAAGTLTSTMPRLAGSFKMTLDEDWFTLTAERAELQLHAQRAERIINRTPDAPVARVEADVPLQLAVRTLHLPTAMLMGETAGDEAQTVAHMNRIALDMRLTGGPAMLRDGRGTGVALSDIRLDLNSSALRDGLAFDLTGKAVHNGGSPGSAKLRGSISDMFDAEGELDFAHAKLDLDADVTRAPTMLLDALIGMNGYLHAAVGPQVNATLVTRDFSTNSGTVDLNITTQHGFLRGKGRARDGLLHLESGSPISAQLDMNPLLREMLLSRLHPLLGDVVSTKEPLRAALANATIPLTGGVNRLNGDVEVNIGEVQFDRRSEMLMMLALARATDSPRLDGSVDPIHARIRNGVIEYDTFNVRIAHLTLPQSGNIDLNTGRVALRTNSSLGTLATAFIPRQATDALGGRVGHIVRELNVPILYTGTFGDLKPRIDPEFRLEQKIAQILAESLIQGVIPKAPDLPFINPGGILDELLRRGLRRDENP